MPPIAVAPMHETNNAHQRRVARCRNKHKTCPTWLRANAALLLSSSARIRAEPTFGGRGPIVMPLGNSRSSESATLYTVNVAHTTSDASQLGKLVICGWVQPLKVFQFQQYYFSCLYTSPSHAPKTNSMRSGYYGARSFLSCSSNSKGGQSLNSICRQKGIEIPHNRALLEASIQRARRAALRRLSTRLGQPLKYLKRN
jgi:hypothetical protein